MNNEFAWDNEYFDGSDECDGSDEYNGSNGSDEYNGSDGSDEYNGSGCSDGSDEYNGSDGYDVYNGYDNYNNYGDYLYSGQINRNRHPENEPSAIDNVIARVRIDFSIANVNISIEELSSSMISSSIKLVIFGEIKVTILHMLECYFIPFWNMYDQSVITKKIFEIVKWRLSYFIGSKQSIFELKFEKYKIRDIIYTNGFYYFHNMENMIKILKLYKDKIKSLKNSEKTIIEFYDEICSEIITKNVRMVSYSNYLNHNKQKRSNDRKMSQRKIVRINLKRGYK